MPRIALLLALMAMPAIAWGQPANPFGSQPAPDAIGSPAEFQESDFLAKPYKKEPLSSDPAKRMEQIKKQKEQFTKQKEQKDSAIKLKVHKDLNDVARAHVDKYLKQQLQQRYPEQSFPRDYKELYVSDVVDLPSQANFYTMRVDYVVDLKNKVPGTAGNVWHRCFTLDGNLKVVGSMPVSLQEKEVRDALGTSDKKAKPTREQLKKEAAELKEMKRKPAKPGDKDKPDQ
jgi:hypothetical protein